MTRGGNPSEAEMIWHLKFSNLVMLQNELMNIATLKKEAKSKKTLASRLLELAKLPDPTVQYAVAVNPKAPLAALEYLSGHGKWTILKAVASNPNINLEILEKLAKHKQNTVCIAVAQSIQTPAELLAQLARHSDAAVRRAVTDNKNCTAAIFTKLSEDSDALVRFDVAVRDACPIAVLEKLSQDPDPLVRGAVAWNNLVPIKELRMLATDPAASVRASSVENLRQRGEINLLQTLSRDVNSEVRLEIAKLYAWIPQFHNHLVIDPDEKVRECLAGHHDLPQDQMLILAKDSSADVRKNIASRDDLGQAMFEVLLKDQNPEVRRTLAYAKATKTPAWVLEQLASDPDEDVRWQVAYVGVASNQILKRLTQDPSPSVREAATETLSRTWR